LSLDALHFLFLRPVRFLLSFLFFHTPQAPPSSFCRGSLSYLPVRSHWLLFKIFPPSGLRIFRIFCPFPIILYGMLDPAPFPPTPFEFALFFLEPPTPLGKGRFVFLFVLRATLFPPHTPLSFVGILSFPPPPPRLFSSDLETAIFPFLCTPVQCFSVTTGAYQKPLRGRFPPNDSPFVVLVHRVRFIASFKGSVSHNEPPFPAPRFFSLRSTVSDNLVALLCVQILFPPFFFLVLVSSSRILPSTHDPFFCREPFFLDPPTASRQFPLPYFF